MELGDWSASGTGALEEVFWSSAFVSAKSDAAAVEVAFANESASEELPFETAVAELSAFGADALDVAFFPEFVFVTVALHAAIEKHRAPVIKIASILFFIFLGLLSCLLFGVRLMPVAFNYLLYHKVLPRVFWFLPGFR